jgi:hypothetical protein
VGSALKTAVWGIGVTACLAAPVAAQTEAQLKQAFEGQYVVVRMEMPATHKGVDVNPAREPSVDFTTYSARLREFGVALREGDRVMVTSVRVKKKNIEFHLGGGGYGVWGDDSGYVYVPTAEKSRREKDLEKRIKDERDPERRRRMKRELDDLKDDRHRENRDRDAEKRYLEEQKKSEIADKRLDAGSRVNVWLPEERLASGAPTPAELRRMLGAVIDFGGDGPGPRLTSNSRDLEHRDEDRRDDRRDERRSSGSSGSDADLRRGMSTDDVHDLLGKPVRSKAGKQGDLATLTEWYESGDRITEVTYAAGVVIKFSTSSK